MSEIFNIKFLASIALMMTLPFYSCYHSTLRSTNLPIKHQAVLSLTGMFVTVLSLNLGMILINQIDEKSFSALNFIPVLISFFVARFIHQKFPNLFLKLLFNKKTDETSN